MSQNEKVEDKVKDLWESHVNFIKKSETPSSAFTSTRGQGVLGMTGSQTHTLQNASLTSLSTKAKNIDNTMASEMESTIGGSLRRSGEEMKMEVDSERHVNMRESNQVALYKMERPLNNLNQLNPGEIRNSNEMMAMLNNQMPLMMKQGMKGMGGLHMGFNNMGLGGNMQNMQNMQALAGMTAARKAPGQEFGLHEMTQRLGAIGLTPSELNTPHLNSLVNAPPNPHRDKRERPKLQNIVSTVNLQCRLDLRHIALNARNAEYNPRRFAAVIMRIRDPKTTALIFASGKMVCTGAKSEEASKIASRRYAKVIHKLGFQSAKFTEFKVQNIVGSCDAGFPIRLDGLNHKHCQFCQYEPELFPGYFINSFIRII